MEEPPKIAPNVRGYAELTRQYYTGNAIKIDCYVCAYNLDNTLFYAWSRFKHALTGRPTIERDHPNPNGVEPQRIGFYGHSDTLPHFDIDLKNDFKKYTSDAYVRLLVISGGDNYFIGNTEIFDSNDKPYDAP